MKALKDFLAWWLSELRATLADLVEAVRLRGGTRLVLDVEGQRLTVRQLQRAEPLELGSLTRDAEGHWPMALTPAGATQEPLTLAGATMTAVLSNADVLVKELVLPMAAERSLDQVLGIQALRAFPLGAPHLYFDHRVIQRVRLTRQIVVHLRAAKRAQIDELSQWASGVGCRLDRVAYRAKSGEPEGNFLPHPSWRSIQRFSTTECRLAAFAASLLLAVAALIGIQWSIERHRVNTELATVSAQAQKVRSMWKEVEKQSAPATALIELMKVPDAATVLGQLPDSLPLDSWASQIEIRAPATSTATLNLMAFAPAASQLVDELARKPHFKHVRLIYGATDSFSNQGDRVQLSADWTAQP